MHVPGREYRMVVKALLIRRLCQGIFKPTVLEVKGREGESNEERDKMREKKKENEKEIN